MSKGHECRPTFCFFSPRDFTWIVPVDVSPFSGYGCDNLTFLISSNKFFFNALLYFEYPLLILIIV